VIAESPFFFAKLPDDTDISTHDTQRRLEEVCTRWPNASKAASATIFLVPVCSSVHWSLFAVYKFYDLFWSEGGEACIMHWDSRRPLHRGLEGRIRAFVQKMLQIHGATDSSNVFDYGKLPLREMSMPQQVNGTDCGYLMLYAAMSVCNNAKSPQHLELSESVSAEEKTRRMRAILRNLFRNKGQLDKGDNTISRNH
jgi:Ulp1 family protease